MKKALQILVVLLLIAGAFFIKSYLKPTEILYSGTIETPNITEPVEVYFDAYGFRMFLQRMMTTCFLLLAILEQETGFFKWPL